MHILFFNPQGNFDPVDSYLAEHPDFGGQLIYVKETALAMVEMGHRVDIVTRQVIDPNWPEFSAPLDGYSDSPPGLRIVRIPCGPEDFLNKERLWPHLDEFVENTISFYADELPDFVTAHYADGGYCAVKMQQETGLRFTFTGHSLGAQKMDKLGMSSDNAAAMEKQYCFSQRIAAERLAMEHAWRIITSTEQERREQYAHTLYQGAVEVGDDSRFCVIPPGVNMRIFTTNPGRQDDALSDRLERGLISPERPYVLVSSRLDEKKNVIGVVRAYVDSPSLRNKAGLALCVRGIDDPYTQIEELATEEREVLRPILEMIETAGLRQSVDFLNLQSQQELASAYRFFARRNSVFALTAFYEPFGLAPIEAAASGLACVATRNGGPSEIFADGSGVLVDPFDAGDIARGLEDALDRAVELARRSGERVNSMYTWDKTAAGYLAAISEGIARGPGPGLDAASLDASERIKHYLSDSR